MDILWEDIIPEGSNINMVIVSGESKFEVLAVWIGPDCARGKVPVVKVAGLPDFSGEGTLPPKRFRGMLQLVDDVDRAAGPGLWGSLEVKVCRRARQNNLTFIFRAYNSEPSQGIPYTLYSVPGLDVISLVELVMNSKVADKLEVL